MCDPYVRPISGQMASSSWCSLLRKKWRTTERSKADDDWQEKQAIMPPQLLWKLPDAVLFHVVSYCAPPTHRAAVLCHQLAPVSRDAANTLLHDAAGSTALWEIVLRQDYGVQEPHPDDKSVPLRRACKRLRRSVLQRVQTAHRK